jgi:FkbM family methyltransferase
VILLARFFQFLFRFPFFKKRYFGIYKRIILPFGLFKRTEVLFPYDETLKIKLSLRDWIQQHIYFFGYYDKRGIQFMKAHLKLGDTFIDIGGNIGAYTLIAAKCVGEQGSVIAFEPISAVRNRLLENIAINDLGQVNVVPCAVFNENTELTLHISNQENLGMSSMHAHDADTGKTEKVNAIRLDDYVLENNIHKIDLIKMDIEGAELYALQGMKMVLNQFKPDVLIEITPEVLDEIDIKAEQIYDFFEEMNYSPFCIGPGGEVIAYIAKNQQEYTNFLFKKK